MITVTRILGTASEPGLADRLHHLEHLGRLELLVLGRGDTLRRRLRGRTDKGTDIVIALDRTQALAEGAVLVLNEEQAIVVRASEEGWLRILPRDVDAALEAGYFIGNLHWRVRFEPNAVLIALEGPLEHYTSRLSALIDQDRIRIAQDG
jgi:urease accessory protein